MTTDARTLELREVLRESTGKLASDRFVNVPQTDSARLEVLTRAVAAYRQLAAGERIARLAADYPEAAQYRSELAEGKFHHATLLAKLNRIPEAEQLYRDAFRIWQEIDADKSSSDRFAKRFAARRSECLLEYLHGKTEEESPDGETRAAAME